MNSQSEITPIQSAPVNDINRLPSTSRKKAAIGKYAKAVRLYAATTLPLKTIAQLTGVTATGLSAHLSKYHRNLLFARYEIPQTVHTPTNADSSPSILSTSVPSADSSPSTLSTSVPSADSSPSILSTSISTKVKSPKGQSAKTYLKYKDAIHACSDTAYIELNISEIARMYKLNPTALTAQLKYHFPEILPEREKIRQRLGITDNKQRGPRASSKNTYSEAVQIYRDTDLTMPEVAEKCNVPYGGLSQYIRFYHKDVVAAKALRRKAAETEPKHRIPGTLAGNGSLYGPKPASTEQYAKAMELYRTTSLTLDRIAAAADVPSAGFVGYLKEWQREEIVKRRGYDIPNSPEATNVQLTDTKHYLKSTAEKYAQAIKSLKDNPRPVAKVAEEFKLNPDVFREYLKEHEPELHTLQGMAIRDDGKRVKRSSQEKYHKAIEEYAISTKNMKEIAENHGLVYKSLMSFMKRNCPEAIERHRKLTETSPLPDAQ